MKKLNVGIAGYGVVGKRRRKFIDQNKHMKVVAVSDINFKQDGRFDDGVHFFTNYKKIFSIKLDALFVCLPNKYAPEATKLGLKSNLHVFCEKPPGRNIGDIKKIIRYKKKFPYLKVKYGFNHRYHDSVIEAKKIIDSKKFGEIINFRGVYGKSLIIPFFSDEWRAKRSEAGGGILLDQGIHLLDMILYFSDSFYDVLSFVSNNYWKHDVEDNVYSIMRDKKGRVAMIHSSATEWQHKFRLEITLEKGLIELSGILSSSKSYGEEIFKITKRNRNGNIIPKTYSKKYAIDYSWKREIDEFADVIINNKNVENGSIYDALNVMSLISRIYTADKIWKKKFNIR